MSWSDAIWNWLTEPKRTSKQLTSPQMYEKMLNEAAAARQASRTAPFGLPRIVKYRGNWMLNNISYWDFQVMPAEGPIFLRYKAALQWCDVENHKKALMAIDKTTVG